MRAQTIGSYALAHTQRTLYFPFAFKLVLSGNKAETQRLQYGAILKEMLGPCFLTLNERTCPFLARKFLDYTIWPDVVVCCKTIRSVDIRKTADE